MANAATTRLAAIYQRHSKQLIAVDSNAEARMKCTVLVVVARLDIGWIVDGSWHDSMRRTTSLSHSPSTESQLGRNLECRNGDHVKNSEAKGSRGTGQVLDRVGLLAGQVNLRSS